MGQSTLDELTWISVDSYVRGNSAPQWDRGIPELETPPLPVANSANDYHLPQCLPGTSKMNTRRSSMTTKSTFRTSSYHWMS